MLRSEEIDHINKYVGYYFNNNEKVSDTNLNKIFFSEPFLTTNLVKNSVISFSHLNKVSSLQTLLFRAEVRLFRGYSPLFLARSHPLLLDALSGDVLSEALGDLCCIKFHDFSTFVSNS